MKKKLRRPLMYALLRGVWIIIYLLPRTVVLFLGDVIGSAVFSFVHKERKKALESLSIAFGNKKSSDELSNIAKTSFQNLGKNALELMIMPRYSDRFLEDLIEVEGFDTARSMIEQKKGFVVVSAHLGNWELLAAFFGRKGYSPTVIGKRIYYHRYNKLLVDARKRMGVNTIYRDEAFRPAVKILKNGGFIAVLADQDVDSIEGVFVDFFGKRAYTPVGPVVLAMAARVPLIPVVNVRVGNKYKIIFKDPIEPLRTDNRMDDIVKTTQIWSNTIEDCIRAYPEQWVWMHRRWKTQEHVKKKTTVKSK